MKTLGHLQIREFEKVTVFLVNQIASSYHDDDDEDDKFNLHLAGTRESRSEIKKNKKKVNFAIKIKDFMQMR